MNLLAAGLAMGFLGSSHCVGMCGGIAGALSASGPRAASPRGRGASRALALNLGRIASYAAGGVVAGTVGEAFAGLGGNGGMLALRALAALLIVSAGLYVAGWSAAIVRIEAVGGSWWRRHVAPAARKALASPSPMAPLVFGALWGWLPCGLVYSALAVSATSGSGAGGGLVMVGFGLGTLPATLAFGLAAGRGVDLLRSRSARRLAGAMVIAFGIWTFAAAASAWSHSSATGAPCHGVASAAASNPAASNPG